jgi:hypothetical protein
MSLLHILTGESAQFFRRNPRRRFSNNAASQLVRNVVSPSIGRVEERRIRQEHDVDGSVVHITYACFPIESEPSFLSGSQLREKRYAYVLIIEADETIAVFRKNAEGVIQGLSPFVVPRTYEELGGLHGEDNPAFERISLRAMSLAPNVVRRRSLEAENLANSMAVVGVHRSIPNNFRTRTSEGINAIAPGTSRISHRGPRAQLDDLIRWVIHTGVALNRAAVNYSRTFLAEFCRAVPLKDLPAGVAPNAILFDFSELKLRWENAPNEYEFTLLRSSRATDGRTLSDRQVQSLFTRVEQVLTIDGDEIIFLSRLGNPRLIGRIRINKNSISVRSELLDRVVIRHAGESLKLSTYANQESNFVITFSEPEYGYAERQLFRDSALLSSIDGFLRIFEARTELATVTDEKLVTQAEFQVGGIFRLVEDSLAPRDALLVCDDLGDEWADYIAVEKSPTSPRLVFIHCKHAAESTSATALQEPIGQAIKNLSRMNRGSEEFALKTDNKWNTNYATTDIPRIRRGATDEELKRAFVTILNNPNTERAVMLVLSGLSIRQLNEEFDALRRGTARPHVSQLLWLIAEFIGACREHAVRPQIICQP